MTNVKDSVLCDTRVVVCMREDGRMICGMEKATRGIRMAIYTRAISPKAELTARAFTSGGMERFTMGNGKMGCSTGTGFGREFTGTLTLASGKAARQTATASTSGCMVRQPSKVGDRYEGEWKDCLKHGNGTDIFANGDVYIGQYRLGNIKHNSKGKPCGYGQYMWRNGSTYTGQFENGFKNGFGKYRKSKDRSTNMYEGEYLKDKKHGFGIFKWSSGNVYMGQYREDERDGIGKMQWTDGSIYIGQWERGIQHGYGIMIFPDGSAKEGQFNSNVYKGSAPPIALLKDPNFDVMSLAPEGASFSDEILGFCAVGRTQESSWLPAVNRREYESTDESRKRSRVISDKRTNKKAPRSFSDKRDFAKFNKQLKKPLEQPKHATNSRRWFNKDAEIREYGKIGHGTNTTMYSPMCNYSSAVPEKLKRKTVKQVWRPAGKAHHRSIVVYNPV
eukprot:TRINITY_DN15519_c0_g3_i4.p1 TRINITY_DN15519_c0_g3~~TRINITY_DN15519_c0_g3_i4.p1  ORF type:complete len:447 (+),score=58.34 TRINITY_DN15519_c0_g3_i4:403-1743(+)